MSHKADRREARKKLSKSKKSESNKLLVNRLGNAPEILSDEKLNDGIVLSFDNMAEGYSDIDILNKTDSGIRSNELLKIIAQISRESWLEAGSKTKWSSLGGYELLNKKVKKVKKESVLPDEINNWTVFRYNDQNSRLIGYKYDNDNTFHITHIDHDMDAYKH